MSEKSLCIGNACKKHELVNGFYLHIRTVGHFYIWLVLFLCLSPSVFAQIGFQSDFDPISSWVAPYSEPDYRFSAALHPKSEQILSGYRMLVPKVIRQSRRNNSLTLGATYFQRGQDSFDLVPVSVDAHSFAEFRSNRYISQHDDLMFDRRLARRDQERGGGGLGVSVALPKRLNKIFGEGGAGLRVSGFRKITFSGRSQWTDGQSDLVRQNKFPSLSMEQISRFDITGTIGSKINVKVSQDSETDIPLANRIQIRYKGDEDDILKTIEAGNTNLSLPNTQFVGYSERIQGLFGIRTEAQIGSLSLTAIASQEKGNSEKTSFTATGEESASYIRDAYYADNRIFDLGLPEIHYISVDSGIDTNYSQELLPGDSITRLDVYEQVANNEDAVETRVRASIDVKPQSSGRFFGEDIIPNFGVIQLEYGKDFVFEQNVLKGVHYLIFTSRRQESRAIGVHMKVQRPGIGVIEFGDIERDTTDASDTTLYLKMIRPERALPDHRTWQLMWRNVYDLRQRGVYISDLNVKVLKGLTGRESTTSSLEYQDEEVGSENYIKILGLDQYTSGGRKFSDGLVDDRSEIWRSDWGLLIFPHRRPFDTDTVFADSAGVTTPVLQTRVPSIYNYKSDKERTENSQYFIQIATKNRSSIIRLNRPNIIEGSERILLNGRPLKSGDDYNINYDFGQITLLTDEALDPNSELVIDYEYAGFLAVQKKTLLGMRAEYEWNKNFSFGSTVLYKSDKAQERKPRVGQETSKMALIDFDASLKLQPGFITDLVDALPLVETTVPSSVQLTGEIARSYPNPNINGEAFVDDMESAIERLSLSIGRTNWKKASRPRPVRDDITNKYSRGRLLWHVRTLEGARPDDDVYDRQTPQGQGFINTFRMIFTPDPSNVDSNQSSWAGITRSFKGRIDSDRLQLFELRARVAENAKGKMHIDFGYVNEDLDEDRIADTEIKVSGRTNVVESEDIGLDDLPDGLETDTVFWGTDGDIAGDNFFFGAGSEKVGKCPFVNGCDTVNWLTPKNYYRFLNGTEGNRNDAEYLGLPDQEVLSSGSLNQVNAYISFTVELENTPFLVPNTASRANFNTFRIPILDTLSMDTSLFKVFSEGGQYPDWADINHVRVWFESEPGDTTTDTVEVADWYFVQSNWQDSIIECDLSNAACHPVLPDSEKTSFLVASLSEEDNVAFKNNPPPGVEQYVDPATNVAEPRRALLLKFPVLQKGDTCTATKELITVDRYSGYGRMQLYVYSDIPPAYDAINTDSVMFFFRLGDNPDNFYEFRTRLHNSWDERNWVNIDFNEITALKDSAQKLLPSTQRNKAVDVSSGKYRVLGDPNLNEILFFSAGVVNTFDTAVAGEIWLDELRVTDVRKDAGTAARFNMSGNMADFGNFGFQIQGQDAYFRGLSSATRGGGNNNLGSGQTNTNYSISWSMNLDKFLPPSWGARLPVSLRYGKSISTPILRTRSDVVLPADVRKEEQTVSESQSFSVSESLERKGKNPLFNFLLNRQSVSWSYSRTEGRSVNSPYSFGENYSVKASFDMGVSKVPTLPIFFWTKSLPIVKRTSGTKLGLYPASWNFNANYNRNLRISDDINLKRTSTISRDFSGGVDLRYNLFQNLNTTFSYSTRRDLNNLDEIRISLKDPKLGTEINYRQNFDAKYDPKLLKWLTWSISYDANYNDDYDRTSATRRSDLSRGWGMGGTFDHRALLSGRAAAESSRGRAVRRGGVRTGEGAVKEEEKKEETGTSWLSKPKAVLRFLTGWIEPVSYSYGRGYKNFLPGMLERPSLKYRFGIEREPNVLLGPDTRARSSSEDMQYSFGSGFGLFGGISTTIKYSYSEGKELIKQGPRYKGTNIGWPDLSIRISQFKKFPLIKKQLNKFIDIFSPRTGYTRRVQESFDIDNNFLVSKRVTKGYNPLLSINFKLWRSLSVSGSYTVDENTEERFNTGDGTLQTDNKTQNKTISATSKYSFSAPGGLSIPLFGKVKFTSTVDIDLAVRYASSRSETGKLGQGSFVSSDKSDMSISPTISYSFSRQIRGGLSGRWQDTSDATTNRNSHVRQLQIWVEIRF